MKILFLAHRIPYPPNKGEKIRAFHELKYLGGRHTVDLLCFADSKEEARGKTELARLCRHIYVETRSRVGIARGALRSLLRNEPLSCGCFFSEKFQQEVRKMLARDAYDVIFVFCSAMAQYLPAPSLTPVVLDFVDVDSRKWAEYARRSRAPLSWLYNREARRLALYEKSWAARSHSTVVSTRQEAALLDNNGLLPVVAINNGVEGPRLPAKAACDPVQALEPYVVFIGQMDYRPNVDAVAYFAKDLLPRIQKSHPSLKFVIVGRDPTMRVRRLAKLPGVTVTGAVTEVESYLARSVAVVAPFRIAQGIQNKMLEALAMGKPIVSTRGPAMAIGAVDGETLLIADTAEEFVRAVVALLEDPQLYKHLSNGAEFVRRNFNWQDKLAELEELLLRVARTRAFCDRLVMNRAHVE